MTQLKQISDQRCFGGQQLVFSHAANSVQCEMRFAVFLPSAAQRQRVPALYFLSGLTCTEQNVITKAGAQRYCEEYSVALICPDTSPRGEGVPDVAADDLGMGAGFYVDATCEPWAKHYQMHSYVSAELPALVEAELPLTTARAICGHSMGGHGALTLGVRHAERYASVSAFSPICAPSVVPWGKKAFSAYLGEDPAAWAQYDASALITEHTGVKHALLVDVGERDPFLETQLLPERLKAAAERAGHPLRLRVLPGYDHSYYFVASFIAEHVRHHALALGA